MAARLTYSLLLGCLLLKSILLPQQLWAVSLQELLDNMPDTPATLASIHEEERIDAELHQRRSLAGWSLFGGLDAGHYRDPDSAGMQQFDSHGAQLGLRYPLLGSMQARKDSITDARVSLAQARQMTRLTRSEQRMLLRQSYIDWWHLWETSNWCAHYTRTAQQETTQVATRTESRQLRVSERLWTEQRWRNLLRPCQDLEHRKSHLKQRIGYLLGQPLPAGSQPQPPELPIAPAPLQSWHDILEAHPALQLHRIEEQELQPMTQSRWSDRVDASLSLSQRYDQRSDLDSSGGGLVASITFEAPLSGIASSRETPAAARQRAAYQRVVDTRTSLLQSLELKLQQYRQQLDSINARQLQLDYATQLVQEQTERQRIDNDFMALRMAHIEEANTRLELIDDWHSAWSLLAELENLSEEPLALLGDNLLQWPGESAALPDMQMATTQAATWRQSIYVWDSSTLLDPQQRTQEIHALHNAGFNHIHLGFNARQVARLEQLAAQVRELLTLLRAEGFSVDLLLGDPDWIPDEGRQHLVRLIEQFSALPFDQLHLDLEVEQLGWPVPASRVDDWLQTLEAASKASPWPVTLVSHHRWFAPAARNSSQCVPCRLPDLGINNATIMLYSTAEPSVIQRSIAIAEAWPALNITLAQSIEASLPAENSWHGASPGQLRALNIRMQTQLHNHRLAGIAWQDWQQYPKTLDTETPAP